MNFKHKLPKQKNKNKKKTKKTKMYKIMSSKIKIKIKINDHPIRRLLALCLVSGDHPGPL